MTVSHLFKGGTMGVYERKEREKEHRKEEIVDAAQKVFFEKGLLVATMDDIAEAAELSKGTLYLYNKSKEDLYLAVMMRGMQKLYKMLQQVIETKDTTVKKLIEVANVYQEFATSSSNYFRMFHFFQTSHFHKQVSDEMREICNAESAKIWDLVSGLLKHGMDEGVFRSNLNPVEVAIILWSSATSLMLRLDNEGEVWKEHMNIDLHHTLGVSNRLFFESIITNGGRDELTRLLAK